MGVKILSLKQNVPLSYTFPQLQRIPRNQVLIKIKVYPLVIHRTHDAHFFLLAILIFGCFPSVIKCVQRKLDIAGNCIITLSKFIISHL